MMLRIVNLWERVRSSYWFVPSLMAMFAIALSFAMAGVDAAFGAKYVRNLDWIYTGGPDGARGVLGAIAGSVIGVAGTTFSILIAVLSLTSGQFGPRLLRSFMRDAGNQFVLGTFTSTFLYCLMVLRTIRGTDQSTYVPHFSVTLGVALAILSVGVLIYFVHHVAESIQVSHLIEEIGNDADEAVNRLFPDLECGEPEDDATVPDREGTAVSAGPIGYVQSIDVEALMRVALKHEQLLRIEVRPGDYVLPKMKLLTVWPNVGDVEATLQAAFSVGRWRTTLQDAEFAFLQLTEIAVRALSPGINDPFTAIQCLDRITASMCLLASRDWPRRVRKDESGAVRVLTKPYDPKDLVEAAYGHIRHAAKASPAVQEKLKTSIDTLIARAKEPELRVALADERRRVLGDQE